MMGTEILKIDAEMSILCLTETMLVLMVGRNFEKMLEYYICSMGKRQF